MDIIIKKLTPELTEDYLLFFDNTPHSTGKQEHRCYCVCWASTPGNPDECRTAIKRRAVAAEYIKNHYIQGYLAYYRGTVVGWCNANTKSDCYECISWKMFMKGVKKDNKKVKSVFCFAVAPDFRSKGIASMLLEKVCTDAEKDGFDCVEAYPNTEYLDEEQDYMGPIGMYEKLGFTIDYRKDSRYVMSRVLDK